MRVGLGEAAEDFGDRRRIGFFRAAARAGLRISPAPGALAVASSSPAPTLRPELFVPISIFLVVRGRHESVIKFNITGEKGKGLMAELAIPSVASGEPEDPRDDPSARRILSVRLYPHRSLTQAEFLHLLMLFSLMSFATTLPFVIIGAWPIAGFMGLDVALFYFAFRANFRAARAYEDVRVTPLELMLAKVSPRGVRAEWRFNPSWVRLDKVDHEEFGIQRLALVSRGQSVEIGHFLGPDEKAHFAEGLSRALTEARRGPRFS